MVMDLLDFSGEHLYFDETIELETQECIDMAAENYGDKSAEDLLLRAYFLEPEHPVVLVALYRFFYYQFRYQDALRIADRVLKLFSVRLELPHHWQEVTTQHIDNGAVTGMVDLRFFLLALKGAGYLELRLELFDSALERLKKVVELDAKDRLGAASLLEIAQDEINRKAGIYRLKF